jgi:hypothetical protein
MERTLLLPALHAQLRDVAEGSPEAWEAIFGKKSVDEVKAEWTSLTAGTATEIAQKLRETAFKIEAIGEHALSTVAGCLPDVDWAPGALLILAACLDYFAAIEAK